MINSSAEIESAPLVYHNENEKKHGPWPSCQLTHKLATDVTPMPTSKLSELSTEMLSALRRGAHGQFDVKFNDLCKTIEFHASQVHCAEMANIASACISGALETTHVTKVLQAFLSATAKTSQLCNFSGYVARASELQILGLAYGDRFMSQRAEEAAARIRHHRNAAAAADEIWVFLTAKAPEIVLFDALGTIEIDAASAHALAALTCACAEAGLMKSERHRGLIIKFSSSAVKRANELPHTTLARLATAIACFGPACREALEVLISEIIGSSLHRFTEEELVDLVVASSSLCFRQDDSHLSENQRAVTCLVFKTVSQEVSKRLSVRRPEACWPQPGSRVRLKHAHINKHVGANGVLAEFSLATGCWRTWLDCGLFVDVAEENFEVLDNGMMPSQCCQDCWKMQWQLHHVDNACLLCSDCLRKKARALQINGNACQVSAQQSMLQDGYPFSARNAARLCCSFALARTCAGVTDIPSKVFEDLCRIAESIRYDALHQKPFEGITALSDTASAKFAPELPVLVVNLDRSFARLEDMGKEVKRCRVRARRFPATDGRHRVVRRSSAIPYLNDLTDFALGLDESRPAIGVALTADTERHYVGYVGSWLSHTQAIWQAMEEGFPYVAVLEDDQVLSPDFNDVVQDILDVAGHTFDVVILGPLSWRLRSLRYAQERKVIQLTVPCPDASPTAEEKYVESLLGFRGSLKKEETYFLYSIGCKAMGGDDHASIGCCGAWGYLVSRRGSQKMKQSMKIMWESFDDVLQAELQGDNRFTKNNGQRRLWGVWPPLVTSDGKWPSQNSGEDLDMGRQLVAVSPHAGFRDSSLASPVARLVLGPGLAFHEDARPGGCPNQAVWSGDRTLTPAAATALLWSPVEAVWAYTVTSWRRLFDQRNGGGDGFELRSEMQLRLHSSFRFFGIASEGLSWSWSLLRAAYLFGLSKPSRLPLNVMPPDGPPVELLPFSVHIIRGPVEQLLFCPDAWFRDLSTVLPDVNILMHVDAETIAHVHPFRDLISEIRPQLPRACLKAVNFKTCSAAQYYFELSSASKPILALAAGIKDVDPTAIQILRSHITSGSFLVLTAHSLGVLFDVLNELVDLVGSEAIDIVFAGVNPFGSWLIPQARNSAIGKSEVSHSPFQAGSWARLRGVAHRPELEDREAFLMQFIEKDVTPRIDISGNVASEPLANSGLWRLRLSDGEELILPSGCIDANEDSCNSISNGGWPPGPLPADGALSADEVWCAAWAHQRAETYDHRVERVTKARPQVGTNSFWMGLRHAKYLATS